MASQIGPDRMARDASRPVPRDAQGGRWFAWITLVLAAWIIGGVTIVSWALDRGSTSDAGFSVYHVPGYTGLLALAAFCVSLLVRARRQGRPWRSAFPPGYGVLGAGLVTLLAYVVLDIGWREGVGIGRGIEGSLAPSRVVLAVGLVLIAVGPLRAASGPARGAVVPWAAALSGALVLAVLWFPGAMHPVVNPWMERPADSTLDDSEIWVMDGDGSLQTRLIEAGDNYELGNATWSPDGTHIAYARWRHDDDGDLDADIWTAAADGSDPRAVVEGPGWQWIPHWSPDGAWIVYTDEAPGGPGMASAPIPPAAGQGPLGPGFDLGPRAVRQSADIWRVLSDGSAPPERLTDAPGDDRAATYSPDGTRLAFDSTRDGDTEIYIMGADGSDPQRLTQEPGDDWGQSWSPDGSRIAFNSARSGPMHIYLMAADGAGVMQLTADDVDDVAPAWSPDGSRIAFTRRGEDEEIWSVAADGTDPLDLSRSPSSNDSVWDDTWGPDGRILYIRSGFGPITSSDLVTDDLAAAGVVLAAFLLILMVVLVASTGAPFGAFAAMLGIATAVNAVVPERWSFILPAVVAGLMVDVLVRLTGPATRVRLAGAASGAVFVLAAAAAVAFTSGLAWTSTLLLGLSGACAALGWGVGAIVERHGVDRTTSLVE